MKHLFKIAWFFVIAALAVGCSGTRSRSGGTGKSPKEIADQLAQLEQDLSVNGADPAQLTALQSLKPVASNKESSTYYTESTADVVPKVVMPLNLGLLLKSGVQGALQTVKAYFFVIRATEGFRGGLIIDGTDQGQSGNHFVAVFANNASIVDNVTGQPMAPGAVNNDDPPSFVIRMNNSVINQTIVLESFDLSSDDSDLDSDIQFRVGVQDNTSNQQGYLGKINGLHTGG